MVFLFYWMFQMNCIFQMGLNLLSFNLLDCQQLSLFRYWIFQKNWAFQLTLLSFNLLDYLQLLNAFLTQVYWYIVLDLCFNLSGLLLQLLKDILTLVYWYIILDLCSNLSGLLHDFLDRQFLVILSINVPSLFKLDAI